MLLIDLPDDILIDCIASLISLKDIFSLLQAGPILSSLSHVVMTGCRRVEACTGFCNPNGFGNSSETARIFP